MPNISVAVQKWRRAKLSPRAKVALVEKIRCAKLNCTLVQKWPCVQKRLREKLSTRSKVTLVQKIRRAKLSTVAKVTLRKKLSPRSKVTLVQKWPGTDFWHVTENIFLI